MNPYEPPASTPQRLAPRWFGLFHGRRLPIAEQQRLLDDFAHAVHQTRVQLVRLDQKKKSWFPPRVKRRIIKSLLLDDQFSPFPREQYWELLWKHINCPSPEVHSSLLVQDAVKHIVDSGQLGDRIPPGEVTVQQWINAQVFAGVQTVTIEQCGVSKEAVYRSAHFVKDLDCC